MNNTFKATVQYGDWEGTASADGDLPSSVTKHLKAANLIQDDEFVIALNYYSGVNFVAINAYLHKGENFDAVNAAILSQPGPVIVRKVRLEMQTDDFLRIFKRFDVVLTRNGMNLQDLQFESED